MLQRDGRELIVGDYHTMIDLDEAIHTIGQAMAIGNRASRAYTHGADGRRRLEFHVAPTNTGRGTSLIAALEVIEAWHQTGVTSL